MQTLTRARSGPTKLQGSLRSVERPHLTEKSPITVTRKGVQGPEAGQSPADQAALHLGAGSHCAGANCKHSPTGRHPKSNKVSLRTLQSTALWRTFSAFCHYCIYEVMHPISNSLKRRFIRVPWCKALWEDGTQVNTIPGSLVLRTLHSCGREQ